MKKSWVFAGLMGIFVFLVAGVVSALTIDFLSPTPDNNTQTTDTSIMINASIETDTFLKNVSFVWDNESYHLYDESLILYLTMNNNSLLGENSTYVVDSSSRSNHGTLSGPLYDSSGFRASGFTFNGITDMIDLNPINESFISVSAWVRPLSYNSSQTYAGIYDSQNYGDDTGFLLAFGSNIGGLQLWVGNESLSSSSGLTFEDVGTWHFMAFTFNASDGNGTVYLDGVAKGSRLFHLPTDYVTSYTHLGRFGSNNGFNGTLDEIRVWNKTLSRSQMANAYASQVSSYLHKINSTTWNFFRNQSSISQNVNHTYALSAFDITDSSNSSGIRTLISFEILSDPFLNISFRHPTPVNGSVSQNSSVMINATLNSTRKLTHLTLNWNHTRYPVYDDSLLVLFNFNNNSNIGETTTLAVDASSYSNHGDFMGGATWHSGGKYGDSLSFDGVNDYVNLSSPLNNTDFTIAMWVNPASYLYTGGAYSGLYDSQDYGADKGFALLFSGNSIGTLCLYGGNDYACGDSGLSSLDVDRWTYIVASFNGSTNLATVYVNGVEKSSKALNSLVDYSAGYSRLGNFGGSSWFNGSIDEFRYWNRTLSLQEINQRYRSNLNYLSGNASQGYSFSYFSNQTNLQYGPYSFNLSGLDTVGTENATETRTFNSLIASLSLNFPSEYQIFQRFNASTGTLKISGSFSGASPVIKAGFNGTALETIYSGSSGHFTAYLNATVGQGDLRVQLEDGGQTINQTRYNISIGDIFVVSGQSNSVMQGVTPNSLNESNSYHAVAYHASGWRLANDPIPYYQATSTGSAFPLLANKIMQNQRVPVGFIHTGYNNNGILKWTNDTGLNESVTAVSDGTNGTLRVKAFLFYQGENDISGAVYSVSPAGDYDAYKNNLSWLIDQLSSSMTFESFILGQVNRQGSSVANTDNIRRAQRDLWTNKAGVSRGILTYDIGPLTDGIHFKTDQEIAVLSERWWASLGTNLYGLEGSPPILTTATLFNATSVVLAFNASAAGLKISVWNATTEAALPKGISLTNGTNTITDSGVISSVVLGDTITLTLNTSIDSTYTITLGSGFSNYGLATIRNNDSFGLPVEPVDSMGLSVDTTYPHFSTTLDNNGTLTGSGSFNTTVSNTNGTVWLAVNGVNITATNQSHVYFAEYSFNAIGDYNTTWHAYGNGVTHLWNQSETRLYSVSGISSATAATTTTSSRGGIPVYYPTESNLQEGYSRRLGKAWKLHFDWGDESHQLSVDHFNASTKTATITLSSDPQTKTLSVGETWRVNLDNDTTYDLSVRLDNVTSMRANVFIQEINEEIESKDVAEGVDEDQPALNDQVNELSKDNKSVLYAEMTVVFLVAMGLAFAAYKKMKKKKSSRTD